MSEQSETLINRVKLAMLTLQRASWEQGVAAQALLELGEIDLAVLLAREAVLRQLPDGRLAGLASEDAVTDPAANGVPVLYAARYTGDPQLQEAAARMLDYLLHTAPRTKDDGTLHHIYHAPQVWVDSLLHGPALPGGRRSTERGRPPGGGPSANCCGTRRRSSIRTSGTKASRISARRAFWGVGNGWAAAGMTRVIHALPREMDETRARLVGYVHEVLDGCLAHQRPDGLFHNVVDDPSTFVETNLAQMLAYTIYRGVLAGWLARDYLPAAEPDARRSACQGGRIRHGARRVRLARFRSPRHCRRGSGFLPVDGSRPPRPQLIWTH